MHVDICCISMHITYLLNGETKRYGEYMHNGSGMLSWDESSSKDVDELDPKGRFPHGLKWLHEQVGGSEGMGNFIQHMGKWRADTVYIDDKNHPEWDWKVYVREGSVDSVYSTAWTDSPAFYDSLFKNATEWGPLKTSVFT